MLILKGIPDSKYGTFLSAKMNIAAENLENAEAAHPPHYKPQESRERANVLGGVGMWKGVKVRR